MWSPMLGWAQIYARYTLYSKLLFSQFFKICFASGISVLAYFCGAPITIYKMKSTFRPTWRWSSRSGGGVSPSFTRTVSDLWDFRYRNSSVNICQIWIESMNYEGERDRTERKKETRCRNPTRFTILYERSVGLLVKKQLCPHLSNLAGRYIRELEYSWKRKTERKEI